MAGVSARSLQQRLFLLLVIAFLPVVGILWFVNGQLRDLETRAHEQELRRIAEVTAVEYNQLLQDSRTLLGVLAEFPEVRDALKPQCDERLSAALRHAPQYTTISVINEEAYLVCGALPAEGELYLGDRAYYVLTSSFNRFSVGEYGLGRITGKPGVGVAYPLGEEGETASVLAASIDLSLLADSARRGDLPEGTSLTILDRNGTVLVRRPMPAGGAERGDTLGAPVPESFPAMPEEMSAQIVRATDLQGEEAVFAVAGLAAGSAGPEGYLTVSRPVSSVETAVSHVVTREILLLAGAGLVLLIMAWILGHYHIVKGVHPEYTEG